MTNEEMNELVQELDTTIVNRVSIVEGRWFPPGEEQEYHIIEEDLVGLFNNVRIVINALAAEINQLRKDAGGNTIHNTDEP